jgi:MoaA/NifB/PqqE/SkfB family radical SAM enzyme
MAIYPTWRQISFKGRIKEFLKKYFYTSPPPKLFSYYQFLLRIREAKKRLRRKTVLSFSVHLVEHCNLKCRGCEHFSCLAKEEFLGVDIFERDFIRLSELTKGQIERISLLGGEPLLHPRITDFFEITRKYFPSGNVLLVTNGILLSKQDDKFWQSCKKNNIQINVTKYPINTDYQKVENLVEKFNVDYQYFGGDIIKQMWKRTFDIDGKQNRYMSFKSCYMSNNCTELVDGKIYPCPMTAYVRHFNRYFATNLAVTENDYIDIFKVKNIGEVFDFLCKPIPFCRYCNNRKITYRMNWGVSKKEISEWT